MISGQQKIVHISGTKLELHITEEKCDLFLQYKSKTDSLLSKNILKILTINPCGYVEVNKTIFNRSGQCLSVLISTIRNYQYLIHYYGSPTVYNVLNCVQHPLEKAYLNKVFEIFNKIPYVWSANINHLIQENPNILQNIYSPPPIYPVLISPITQIIKQTLKQQHQIPDALIQIIIEYYEDFRKIAYYREVFTCESHRSDIIIYGSRSYCNSIFQEIYNTSFKVDGTFSTL
eukprot:186579_1